MELFIFARFHAEAGKENEVAETIQDILVTTRSEPGCLGINAFRSVRDPRLFYIHSRWTDEQAFDLHATLPHTVGFIERVQALLDRSLDVTRVTMIG
jgi:quinol monooxygenase YgiN